MCVCQIFLSCERDISTYLPRERYLLSLEDMRSHIYQAELVGSKTSQMRSLQWQESWTNAEGESCYVGVGYGWLKRANLAMG